jgi:DNA-binding LacI/PurR family transcriptional regulator
LAVEHLWALGCRRLLILGTHTAEAALRAPDAVAHTPSPALVSEWERRGGTWSFLASDGDASATSGIRLDVNRLVELVQAQPAPEAIVGLRDVEVWEAQQVLRRHCPAEAAALAWCGMFDTPWSRTGNPPFSSVSVNIPAMVAAAIEIVENLRAGKPPGQPLVRIPPQLVARP